MSTPWLDAINEIVNCVDEHLLDGVFDLIEETAARKYREEYGSSFSDAPDQVQGWWIEAVEDSVLRAFAKKLAAQYPSVVG